MLAIVMGMSGELFASDVRHIDFGKTIRPVYNRPYEQSIAGLSFDELVAEAERVDNELKIAEENYNKAREEFLEKERLWREKGGILPKPAPDSNFLEFSKLKEVRGRKRIFEATFRKKVPDSSGEFIKGD